MKGDKTVGHVCWKHSLGALNISGYSCTWKLTGSETVTVSYQAEKSGSSRERGQWRRGALEKGGGVNHQPVAKSRQSCRSRVRPGEHGTSGTERNRVKDFAPFTKSARRPGKEREEGAAERSKGVMRPGVLSGMVHRTRWAELRLAAWSQGLDISRVGFSRKNEAGRLGWAFKLVTIQCFSPGFFTQLSCFLGFVCKLGVAAVITFIVSSPGWRQCWVCIRSVPPKARQPRLVPLLLWEWKQVWKVKPQGFFCEPEPQASGQTFSWPTPLDAGETLGNKSGPNDLP